MSSTRFIMAIDSSHLKGSVAVSRGDELLCEILFDASDTHSATLLPAVDVCLRSAHLGVKDIDLFGIVRGPGSFTGLRIGLATIKALAAVKKRPVVSATSLEVLAAAFPYLSREVVPIIDARRGEVYLAIYSTKGGLPSAILEPVAVRPEEIPSLIEENCQGPVIFCGTGIKKYREAIEPKMPPGSSYSVLYGSVPRASLLIAVTRGRVEVEYEELSELAPLYIRPPDAKLPDSTDLNPGGSSRWPIL
ncbi:MAG: tRNA (adenosine(37)-N6)-threonylcarbamoyltransferase complex dimerization subunit type 1 TsaB [Candidatus Krumholzibacteriota bacterium]|nr:tRNA (adenosine(37)-N6)-threonylcarbamoyltransferase complex dimerization subunit type 1 TsaB [Candidatus Krumholzibacteriota bacterium]